MATTKMRENSFELIRLMAMFMIELYHYNAPGKLGWLRM